MAKLMKIKRQQSLKEAVRRVLKKNLKKVQENISQVKVKMMIL
jgi:hypothetical protein